MAKCQQCHPGGEAGLGPALNDKPLPEFLKKFQVRHGLGTMPSFSEKEISDQQLEDLMEYLKALRRNRPVRNTPDTGNTARDAWDQRTALPARSRSRSPNEAVNDHGLG